VRQRVITALTLLLLTFSALPATANALHGTYQVDFVPISSPAGTPVLTEAQVRNWVSKMSAIYESATGGKIKLEFRTLYPTQTTQDRITSPTGLKGKFPAANVPKANTAVKAILVGVIAKDSSVGFAGIATYNGDEILLNGLANDDPVNISVLVHEFGHNLGLAHANSAKCTNPADLTTCTLTEYGDYSDIMGKYFKSYVSYDARFNGISLNKLGVLTENQVFLANTTAELELVPLYGTQPGFKVIYLPLYNRMGYAVEYRPATGVDSSLNQTQIFTSNNSYYTNTPSYGLQVRFIGGQVTATEKFLPDTDKTSNTIFFNRNQIRQGMDAGDSITLPDGSVVSFVSGSGDSAVKVKIERTADTTAPTINTAEFSLVDEGKLPKFQLEYESLSDDRYVTKLELLINSNVVTTITNPGVSGVIEHQLTSAKPFSYQLIATDGAGNQSKSAVTPAVVGCSNEKCYVGATWEVEAPSWKQKLGNAQLQVLVNKAWKIVTSSAPVRKDGLWTYDLKYTPTKTGKFKYRIYVLPTKNWAAYIDRPFTQQVPG
jgi:hypothetical protein